MNNEFELFGYVILENHIHIVARSRNLGADIQRFKAFTAKKIMEYLQTRRESTIVRLLENLKRQYKTDSTYQVWEEGSHPQIIADETILRQKLEYIHFNPVKRGYVDLPEHWRYSSARNYAGQEGLIEVFTQW
ncbi:MAG: transposase [Pseudomonadota bacterium]